MKIKEYYIKYKEIINYLIFGGLTTLVNFLVYYGLIMTIFDANKFIELQIVIIISWICAVVFAYITNRKYVFESTNKPNKEVAKFFLSRIGTLLIEMFFMYLLVTILHFNDKVMKIITQIFIIVLNYILSKFIVFKGE